MSDEPILVIKDNDSTIGIRARIRDEFSEHEIQLHVILAYYWDNGLPVIENIIGLFESSLKRTINDVIPHENLFLKYNLITDDEISKASRFEIHLKEVKADNQSLRLDGKILALKGLTSKEEYSKGILDKINILSSNNGSDNEEDWRESDSRVEKLVEKTIPTEKKISFKDFAREQRLRNGK